MSHAQWWPGWGSAATLYAWLDAIRATLPYKALSRRYGPSELAGGQQREAADEVAERVWWGETR